MQDVDVIIVGAGAAGMMCAVEAAKRGRRVLLVDHSPQVGAKILISGGGRCNFTNKSVSAENYVSQNPDFCRSALARYTPEDFIALVDKHQIAYHEKKLGQLFCDASARQIVDMLVAECGAAGVGFQLDTSIMAVKKTPAGFELQTSKEEMSCTSLVIATGGLSIPKTGASGFGYDIARQFGLKIIPTAPALDGFLAPVALKKDFEKLSGVSLGVVVSTGTNSFRENILFTHKGLSGPAALQASLHWKLGLSLILNLIPETHPQEWMEKNRASGSKAQVQNLLLEFFPKSFADFFAELNGVSGKRLLDLGVKELQNLVKNLSAWEIKPEGTVGYSKAEVTRGGVSTEELSSKTMESKKVPGLYFIGEVVDVTGWLGGYNFQWAWSSGWVAGQSV